MSMERYQGGMIAVAPEVMREVVAGNIAGLTASQQTEYMLAVCNSLGLNPLVKPMEFIQFPARRNEPAKTVLYPNATAVNMLIDRQSLSVDYSDVHEDPERDIMIQWCYITDGKRQGKDFAALPISREEWQNQNGKNVRTGRKIPLDGEAWANQLMKLTTKARRRAVLAFCGLPSVFGGSDQDARDADDAIAGESRIVDTTTGEVTARDALPVLEAPNAPAEPAEPAEPSTVGEIQDDPAPTQEKPKRKPRAATGTPAKAAAAKAEQEEMEAAADRSEPPKRTLEEAEAAFEDKAWEEFQATRGDIFNTLSFTTNLTIKSWADWYAGGFKLGYAYQMIAADYREQNRPEADKDLDEVSPPAGAIGHPETPDTIQSELASVADTQDDLPF